MCEEAWKGEFIDRAETVEEELRVRRAAIDALLRENRVLTGEAAERPRARVGLTEGRTR